RGAGRNRRIRWRPAGPAFRIDRLDPARLGPRTAGRDARLPDEQVHVPPPVRADAVSRPGELVVLVGAARPPAHADRPGGTPAGPGGRARRQEAEVVGRV